LGFSLGTRGPLITEVGPWRSAEVVGSEVSASVEVDGSVAAEVVVVVSAVGVAGSEVVSGEVSSGAADVVSCGVSSGAAEVVSCEGSSGATEVVS
jgi:hypothetical protein